MTSQRKLKKRAEALGLTGSELQLLDLLDEVLEGMRWMQILAYTNQYVLNQKLEIPQDERDQILEAATRAVDKDQKFHEWRRRLDRIKQELNNINRSVGHAHKREAEIDPEPMDSPGEEMSADGG